MSARNWIQAGAGTTTVRPDTHQQAIRLVGYALRGSSGNTVRIRMTNGTDTYDIQSATNSQRNGTGIIATRDLWVELVVAGSSNYVMAFGLVI